MATNKLDQRVEMHLMDFSEGELLELTVDSLAEALPYLQTPSVAWLNLTNVRDESIIEEIAAKVNLHPLVLEDIITPTQRPKVEEYDDYLVVILKMAYFSSESHSIVVEQISLLVGQNYVISMQERAGDLLESL